MATSTINDGATEFNITSRFLKTQTKQGLIPKNPDGTYTVCVGSLDQISKADGLFYSSHGAEKFFSTQGRFMDNLDKNYLFGECGHPEREVGMTDEQWLQRNMIVVEKHISHTIHAVRMVPNFKDPETGETVIALMADIKPAGLGGAALERDLNTPGVNVSFSIRCLTVPKFIGGRSVRVLYKLVTFDWVNRPGMSPANKYNSLTCQSHGAEEIVLPKGAGQIGFDSGALENIYRAAQASGNNGLGLQSAAASGLLEEIHDEIIKHRQEAPVKRSGAYNW